MRAKPKRVRSVLLGLVAALAISGPARGQDEVSAQPELPYGAVESFIEIHAFFNELYYQNGIDGMDKGQKGFHASEFYLMFLSRISPQLYFNAELEQQPGLKPEEFNVRRLEIHWAMARWIEADFGKFYCPVGIERYTHYAPLNRLISRPLPALYVIPGTWPEVGVRLNGDLELFDNLEVRYEVAVVNGLGGPLRDDRQNSDNNEELAVAGRIGVTMFKALTLGASGYQGTYDLKDKFLIIIRGLDLSFRYQGLTVTYEYLDSRMQLPWYKRAFRTGYYAQASYRIKAEAIHLVFIEPAVRFDHMDEARKLWLMSDVPDLDRFSLGLSFSPVPHFQFKAEYQWLWYSYPTLDKQGNIVLEAVIDV
ncbi:MAG TPA: hypothetical protein VM658_15755 [bacterium]|nr:hypothetical protein [bacterium]